MNVASNFEAVSRNDDGCEGRMGSERELSVVTIQDNDHQRRYSIFNSPVLFAALGMTASALWLTGISYIGGTVSTIEKRMQLKSSESGLFPVVNDCVGLFTLLFVIHYGQSRHRPRIIAVLYMIVALGYFLHAVPHFLYELPKSLRTPLNAVHNSSQNVDDVGQLCTVDGDTICTEETLAASGPLWREAIWIIIGQALCSCGTCVYPLMITYLDDCVPRRSMGVYLGALFSTIAIGSAIGYGLATLCLHLPNFLSKPDYEIPSSPDDPRWIGNWWLGFIITGALIFITSIPLCCFPRIIDTPVTDDDKCDSASVDSEEYVSAVTHGLKLSGKTSENESLNHFLPDLFQSVLRIITNLTVISLILCTTAISGFIAGFQLFGAKYIQYEFSFPPNFASILFGLLLVPAGIFGNIIGGFIMKHYAHSRLALAKMVLICSIICLIFNPTTLLFGCNNKVIANLNSPDTEKGNGYVIDDIEFQEDEPLLKRRHHSEYTLLSECNIDCSCSVQYDPVCSPDGVTYVSPCHAGCTDYFHTEINGDNKTMYFNCDCIGYYDDDYSTQPTSENNIVNEGECRQECLLVIPYLIAYAIILTAGIMCGNPIVLLEIRSVERRDRSMAIALGNFLGKLFGYIPGPIFYGAIIDTACLLFQTSCGATGNCLVYDVVRLRYSFNGTSVALQCIGIIFVIIAYYSVRCQTKPKKKEIDCQL